ncbi:MAG: prepilin peptidase, partial [Clostridia bacterium]|nr:prepilin peptidase [Clostridia bacterium]
MTNQSLIVFSLFLIFYNIGGLATTNILRLTKGNKLTIHSSKCVCDNCDAKIPPFLQLPIISYIMCKGKCRNCGCRIPIYPLFLEIVIFLGMSIVS